MLSAFSWYALETAPCLTAAGFHPYLSSSTLYTSGLLLLWRPLVLLDMVYKWSVSSGVHSRAMTPTVMPLSMEETYKQDSSQWYKSTSSLCLQYYVSMPQGLLGLRINPGGIWALMKLRPLIWADDIPELLPLNPSRWECHHRYDQMIVIPLKKEPSSPHILLVLGWLLQANFWGLEEGPFFCPATEK